VRSQILIADGKPMHGDEVGIPAQEDIPRNGFAVQCRITTEDPENKFQPDYGRILTYRSAGGFGVRLDGGMGYAGSVVTPFYDSLLVKLTASGPTFAAALQRMDRALREFRIRGVKTNIPFLENVIHHEEFTSGRATTTLIDTTPELFNLKTKRDRATKILNFLGDVTVNGNPQAKNFVPKESLQSARIPAFDRKQTPPKGTRQLLLDLGPKKFAEWTLKQKQLLVTDTTFRDAHQSLFATRMRTYDMLAVADAVARRTPNLYSMEMWGGATFDPRCASCTRTRGCACAPCASGFRTSAFRCSSAARTPWAIPIIPTTPSPVS
jgi:pyruvate carboxylase